MQLPDTSSSFHREGRMNLPIVVTLLELLVGFTGVSFENIDTALQLGPR